MKKKAVKYKWLVGVDEAGRGPLAGPVFVGVFAIPYPFDEALLNNAYDSKKMSAHNRECMFTYVRNLRGVQYAVAHTSHTQIDKKGINPSVQDALTKALHSLSLPKEKSLILLDGGLKAPNEYPYQQTIIRGDASKKVISVASILAKVSRDRHMTRIAKRYPLYCFETHKGYGTVKHRTAIQKYGLSPIHRVSFCKNIIR